MHRPCMRVQVNENNGPLDQCKTKLLIEQPERSPALQAGNHLFYSRELLMPCWDL